MKEVIISAENMKSLVGDLLGKGYRVVSESQDGLGFNIVANVEDFILRSDRKPTNVSMKEFFFPRTEPVFFYKKSIDGVELRDPEPIEQKTIIFGAKPCDSAALPIVEKLFNWDYHDGFFNIRKENTVIIGLACSYRDESCFCDSVGLSPESATGSDIFMYPIENGAYLAKSVNEKGEKFLTEFAQHTKDSAGAKAPDWQKPAQKFDAPKVKAWIDGSFEHPIWKEEGEMCVGCAQCAFVCPTCHCFDIVDEDCSYYVGRRVKNWDACQFCMFTKHASGHNPREHQPERFRQRVSHKFKYYKDRFDEILCTGCGRCSRGCSVGIDLGAVLERINSLD